MKDFRDPKANPKNTIQFGKARFQILADRMIRIEWAEDGVFEDRPTLAIVNRRTPPVRFARKIKGDTLELRTAALTLKFRSAGAAPSKKNLAVSFSLDGRKAAWFPGKQDPQNLRGTARTLDGSKSHHSELGAGLVSRGGWALVDDSTNIVIDGRGESAWAAPRHKAHRCDLYFLAYGRDYRRALRDAAMIFGRQPLPPLFTLGYWWSRYWAYTDREFEQLVESFDKMKIPIDVLVVDMDWHLEGWTGYTWDRRYFPDPVDFLKRMKSRGLKITLNLHPAQGVGRHEEQFARMTRALGLHPARTKHIPFDCADPKYMRAYFAHLHHPHEKNGVDFWWLDWQQGRESRIEGLDPLPWLNRLHWEDMERRSRSARPLIFSRFGGIGSGRYPIGFSGDTYSIWESLQYQPYFTATASNALYGYWSHDIGGHAPGTIEPELYTRWIQFGVYSPVLRTHTTKNPASERRVWEYPDPYSRIMMDAIRRRYELVPYIYTENRKCFDTAVSLCRPMYYDHPEKNEAYAARAQYMFGDEMLVAPVARPVDATDEMAPVEVWLPEGEWFDTAVGMMEKGGRKITRRYNIFETPVFVRAGAVIPGQVAPMRLKGGGYRDLVVTAWPGGSGEYTLYEDDGASREYSAGRFALIPIRQKERGAKRTIFIGRARGSYKGFDRFRSLEIRLPATSPPKSMRASGRPLKWALRLKGEGWTYDGDEAATIVRVPRFDARKGIAVEIVFDSSIPRNAAMGLKGILSRLALVRRHVPEHPAERLVIEAVQAGNRISRRPETFRAEVTHLSSILKRLPAALRAKKLDYNVAGERKTGVPIVRAILRDFKH